ncbi:hypothetical protein CJU90_5810 [Yarrowia sp. C11]|nr:hypothetical protein CJU90_5810 [Yarrowia sp. C11]KAG5364389.1 hypothetical protein CKK34_3188 [Yarrowia sp. E02]
MFPYKSSRQPSRPGDREESPFLSTTQMSRSRSSSLYGAGAPPRPNTSAGHRPQTAGRPHTSHVHSNSINAFPAFSNNGYATSGSPAVSGNGKSTAYKSHHRSSTLRDVRDLESEPIEPPSAAWSALGALRERIRRLNMESEVEGDDEGSDSAGTETEQEGHSRTADGDTSFASNESSGSFESIESEMEHQRLQRQQQQQHMSQKQLPPLPQSLQPQHTGQSMASNYDHSEDMIDIEMSLNRLKSLDSDLYESLYSMYEEMTALCHLPGQSGLAEGISNNLVALSSFVKILEKKLEIHAIKRINRRSVIGVVSPQGYNSSSPYQSPYPPSSSSSSSQQQQMPQSQQSPYSQFGQQHSQNPTTPRMPRSSSLRSVTPGTPSELGTPSYARRLAAHNRRQKSMSMSPDF